MRIDHLLPAFGLILLRLKKVDLMHQILGNDTRFV